LVFIVLVFIYSILVAIILPIPIEIALWWPLAERNLLFFGSVAIVIGAGKATGSWAIFLLGLRVENTIIKWSKRFRLVEKLVRLCIAFVRRTSYFGLYILLSIPLMTDTIQIYVYSLFNEGGKLLDMRIFVLANFLAGINRALVLALIFLFLGFRLFG